jgi:hypothetical protein
MTSAPRLVVDADPRLAAALRRLAAQRIVCFAGLPGTGKSLLVQQLTLLANGAGRRVHLLQWDVARPPFEASAAGQRYPVVDGVTHSVIRKAVGLWARRAVAAWAERHPDPRHLLVAETPFVGNRLVELAQPLADDAEPRLADASCRFAIAVPSRHVRRFLEAERERRTTSPLHPREREDAPPSVLRDLWRELAGVAVELGVAAPDASPPRAGGSSGAPAGGGSGVTTDRSSPADGPPYDATIYRRVYESVLRHRHVDAIALDTVLPTEQLSVYDFATAPSELVPSLVEADAIIRDVEGRYPDLAVLDREIARWWAIA